MHMALPSVKLLHAELSRPKRYVIREAAGFLGIEIIESESLDISSDYIEFLSETALVAKKIVDCKPLRAFFSLKNFYRFQQ